MINLKLDTRVVISGNRQVMQILAHNNDLRSKHMYLLNDGQWYYFCEVRKANLLDYIRGIL